MPRRKKGSPVHGWVVIDKPEGVTSTQVVGIVRRVFDAQKAGHAGTLDPMATGVLAIALGEATKTVPYAMDATKTYRFTVTFGESRDSDDAEGAVTGTSDKRPSRAEIEAAIPKLTGAISQIPPVYSAIKVDGERAYDLARDGEEVVLEARTVVIHGVRFLAMPDADHAEFEMVCGKGTYVRAWARDLALSLGTLGYVSQLRRLAIGNFNVEQAIGLEPLKGFMHSPAAFEYLRPISTALDGIPALAVTGQDAVRLKSGNPILVRPREFERITESAQTNDLQGLTVFLSTGDGEPVALASFTEGELRPFRVFNFATG
ncbi:MAG TPA: tRNA pseudouridine(55) synthase TruB [Rhizomicrobium sp.]|nr:tRNA pseudouridine(55) synthase TruB [Rhizomicrobium sp.]